MEPRLAATFPELLRRIRNYRYTWPGQLFSEIGQFTGPKTTTAQPTR